MAENLISVAKLRKPHKVSGAFRFMFLREPKTGSLPSHFMISEKGQYLPFFVKSYEVLSEQDGIIQFEEITTPEQARLYNGRELFLEEKMAKKFFRPGAEEFAFLTGYKLLNAKGEECGSIQGITETPMQVFIELKTAEAECLIPLAEDWVVDIDKKKKILQLDFPEELLHL